MDRRKQIHVNLAGDQVDDYDIIRASTGITNDNDLVRHLFRKEAAQARAQARWLTYLSVLRSLREGSISETEADIALGLIPANLEDDPVYAEHCKLVEQGRALMDAYASHTRATET